MEGNGKRTWVGRRMIVAGTLALALVGFVALAAHARGWGADGRKPSPDRQAARIAERLDLSADQEAQVRQILSESSAKRSEIREEAQKKMQGLREETETRLAGVLTPDQAARLRQFREERRERRRDCGPRRGGPGAGSPGGPPPKGE